MIDPKMLDEIATRMSEMMPPAMKEKQQEFEAQMKRMLQAQLSKLDLVTREEFDVQTKVLQKTRQMVEQLEQQVRELDAKVTK